MAAAVTPVAVVAAATEPSVPFLTAPRGALQRLGERFPRLAVFLFPSPPLAHRKRAIQAAFDHALEQATGIPPLNGRLATLEDARLAVNVSHCHCGPAARMAEAHLLAQGIPGVRFHSLQGHYVLLDGHTGLLHDLEAPQGCRRRESLPIWQRERELAQSAEAAADVFERYAGAWLKQRLSSHP